MIVLSPISVDFSPSRKINNLYNERQNVNLYFRDSSAEIKQSVYNRFSMEKQDMLGMLNA